MRSGILFAIALAAAPCAFAADGRADAFAAWAALGPAVWSRVVRIENSRERGFLRPGTYPKVVYAAVFELSGILWFYTDTDGTQSLSLTRWTVARDLGDPGPLFRAIDPGFARWSWIDDARPGTPPSGGIPNGCFVESVAALFRRRVSGAETAAPALLSYYVDTPTGRRGHTVLVFRAAGCLKALDPERSERPIDLPDDLGEDARALSEFLRGGPVAAARTLSIEGDGRPPLDRRWALRPAPAPSAG